MIEKNEKVRNRQNSDEKIDFRWFPCIIERKSVENPTQTEAVVSMECRREVGTL